MAVKKTEEFDRTYAEEKLVNEVLERLCERMHELGLDRNGLAGLLDVPCTQVTRMLRGHHVTLRDVAAAAHVMGARLTFRVEKTDGSTA